MVFWQKTAKNRIFFQHFVLTIEIFPIFVAN